MYGRNPYVTSHTNNIAGRDLVVKLEAPYAHLHGVVNHWDNTNAILPKHVLSHQLLAFEVTGVDGGDITQEDGSLCPFVSVILGTSQIGSARSGNWVRKYKVIDGSRAHHNKSNSTRDRLRDKLARINDKVVVSSIAGRVVGY